MRAQYGNLNSPKVDFFGSDVLGKLGVAVEGSLFDTDGYPDRRRNRREHRRARTRRWTPRRTSTSRNVNVKLDYTPNDRRQRCSSAAVISARSATTARSARSTGRRRRTTRVWTHVQRRRARQPAGSERSAGARLHRLRDVPEQLPRRAGAATPPAQRRPDDAQPARAVQGVGGMAQWCARVRQRATTSRPATDWRWVDGDSEEDALDAVDGQTVTLQRDLGRHAAEPRRRSCRTSSRRPPSWC